MKVGYDERCLKMCLLVLFALPVTAHSQDSSASASSASVDTVLQRAESMVDAGRAAAGRALVDSVLTAAAPGTEAYAEALYARASLAATAGDAERDYLRLTVEYSLSPRAPDAPDAAREPDGGALLATSTCRRSIHPRASRALVLRRASTSSPSRCTTTNARMT